MKKIIITTFILLNIVGMNVLPCFAINVGTYKTETEYGLLDGFKINWKRKNPNEKFIEPREESTKREAEKELQNYRESEYERTKYMYDGKAIL